MEYCTSQYGNMACSNLDKIGFFPLIIIVVCFLFLIAAIFGCSFPKHYKKICKKCGKKYNYLSYQEEDISNNFKYGDEYCDECKEYSHKVNIGNIPLWGYSIKGTFKDLEGYLSNEKNKKLYTLARKVWDDGTREQYLDFREKLKEIFKKAKKIEYIKKQKEISKLAKELNIKLKGGSDEMEMEDLEKYLLGGLVGYLAGDKEILKKVKSKVKTLLSDDASEKKSTKK